MSRTKLKFYIVALDLQYAKYHVIELWRAQSEKLLKACGGSSERLMTFLEFKYGVIQIKDYDLLLQYQLYQPPNVNRSQSLSIAERE